MKIEAESNVVALASGCCEIEVTVKHVTPLGGSEKVFTFGPYVSAPKKIVRSAVRQAVVKFLTQI